MASNTDPRIWRLLDQYRQISSDHRQNIISELDRFSSHQADGLVPYLETLCELLRWESGSNAVLLADLLETCLSEQTESISTETLKSLSDLATSTNQPTRQVGLEAARILYQREPDPSDSRFLANEIDDLLEGGPEERACGYRLLGVTAPEGAVPRLARALDSEDEPAGEAARKGLEDIAAISASWFEGDEPARAMKNFEQLANEVPEITIGFQDALREGLTAESKSVFDRCVNALIRLGYSEYCDQLDDQAIVDRLDDLDRVAAGRVAGVVAGGQPDVDPEVVRTVLDQIESHEDDTQQRVFLIALLQIAKRKSEPVAQYAGRIRELDSQFLGQAGDDYIDLLGEILPDTGNPGTIAPLLLGELQSSDNGHVRKACENLSETNLYPLPQAVHHTRNSADDSISAVAYKIYQRSEQPDFSVREHLNSGDEDSALGKLEDGLHYQSESGRWDPLSLPQSELGRLATVREQYLDDSGGYMFLPHDIPEIGILPVAELALTGLQLDEKTDILVYSPGTWAQWGTYEDLRGLFREIGLTERNGITTAALPLDEVFSVCRIADGEVTEWRQTDSKVRIILTRSLDDIEKADPDAVICNFLGRRPADFGTQFDTVKEILGSTPIFSLYSFTAKIESPDTFPEYGYPDEVPEASMHLLPGAPPLQRTQRSNTSEISTPADVVTEQLARLWSDRSITVEQIDAKEIGERLDMMHYLAIEMDTQATRQVAKAFKKQTRFVQSLPVPLNLWDEWVREESTGGGQYANAPSYQRIDDIDELREDPPKATVPGTVYDYLTELRGLFDILRQNNPTYERLLEAIEDAIESDERLTVLFRKRSSQQAFEYAFREEYGLSVEELRERGISLLRLDGLRQIDSGNKLIMTQPFAPSEAQFYLSPLYEDVRLLTYSDETDEYVSGQVTARLETLRARQEIPENVDWPAEPAVTSSTRFIGDVSSESDRDIGEAVDRVGVDSDRGISELWAEFEPAIDPAAEPGDTTDRTDDGSVDTWTVRILTEEGIEILKSSGKSVLVRQTRGPMETDRFVWTTVKELRPGDDFLLIPEQTRERLFREGLKAVYGDSIDGTDLLEGLQTWLETLREISRDYDEFQTIYTVFSQAGIEESEDTVRSWFDAAEDADTSLDLPIDANLRIGPDSADEIKTIGETFDYPALTRNATSIERAIELSHGENPSKDRELNEWIVSQIQDSDLNTFEEVSEHTVGTIQHLGRQH